MSPRVRSQRVGGAGAHTGFQVRIGPTFGSRINPPGERVGPPSAKHVVGIGGAHRANQLRGGAPITGSSEQRDQRRLLRTPAGSHPEDRETVAEATLGDDGSISEEGRSESPPQELGGDARRESGGRTPAVEQDV